VNGASSDPLLKNAGENHDSLEWVPSHNGLAPDCLQPQKKTVLFSVA
jgi:hypothetical protein